MSKHLEKIKQIRKNCLSKLSKKQIAFIEMIQRDYRIIEKTIEKKVHPKSIYDLSMDQRMELFMLEVHKMNNRDQQENNRRFN